MRGGLRVPGVVSNLILDSLVAIQPTGLLLIHKNKEKLFQAPPSSVDLSGHAQLRAPG